MKINIPDLDLTKLTIDGKSYNSVAAAYKAVGTATEELDNALLIAWSDLRQQVTTSIRDRESTRNATQALKIEQLEGRLKEVEATLATTIRNGDDAARESKERLEKAEKEFNERLRILQLPSREQAIALLEREQANMAERAKQIDELKQKLTEAE